MGVFVMNGLKRLAYNIGILSCSFGVALILLPSKIWQNCRQNKIVGEEFAPKRNCVYPDD